MATTDTSSGATTTIADSSSGSSASGSGACEGELGCACYDNGTCNDGLDCRDDVCAPPSCGNGALESGEDCDDGNSASGDGCSEACVHEPICFVGNFGGQTTALASFSIDSGGGVQHLQTQDFVGEWAPGVSAVDESSLVGWRRYVYLRRDNQVLPVQILANGDFGGTSDEVAVPGLLGLGATPRAPGVIAAGVGAGESIVLHMLESQADGSMPEVLGVPTEVTVSNPAVAVVFAFHRDEPVLYAAFEPNPFTEAIELVTARYDDTGFTGDPTVETLNLEGSLRGLEPIGEPPILLFTGIRLTGQKLNCSALTGIDPGGGISGVLLEERCGGSWGIISGILQPDPLGPVIFGSSDLPLETWLLGDNNPVDSLSIEGGRHVLRLVRPGLMVVGSATRISTVELDATGAPLKVVDTSDLVDLGLADPQGNNFFQAAALVPCPDA
jgi:cysteine-rich repeat protein